MISGKKLQDQLADARRNFERESVTISGLITDSTRSIERQSARQAELWRTFASIHLVEGDISSDKLLRLRAEREAKIDTAHRSIDIATKELGDTSATMAAIAERLASADAAIQAKRDVIEASASKDDVVVSSRAKLSAILVESGAAERRKADAVADVDRKRPAYDNDELFRYLMARHYGSDSYRAYPLIATFDRLLASSIGFEKAAQEFDLLTGLPGWIENKITDLNGERLAEEDALKAAMSKHEKGIGPLQKARRDIDHEMAVAVASHDVAEINKRNAIRYLKEVAEGTDDLQARIVNEGVQMLKNERRSALERLARRTKSDADDVALEEISRSESETSKVVAEREMLKRRLDIASDRLTNVATAEKRLKSSGWNDSDHKFRDGSCDVGALVRGTLLADAFWRAAKAGHVEPPRETSSNWGSSTGGFGGGSSGTSGGGWSTGGGFGGSDSGWSTGGGFGNDDNNKTGGGF
jgi:hypothetical protein